MAAKRLKRQMTEQCSSSGHQSCPQTWNWQRPRDAATHYCPCECHTPRATCNRCGMGGLSWAQAPQLGFRRQRTLVPTLFQPFVKRVEIIGACTQTSDRHICGQDVEAERYQYIEDWLFDQYEERQAIKREMVAS